MSPLSLRSARAGFTLIELMMAITVMAILMMVAAPHLQDVVMNTRLAGQANDMLGSMMLARSEATKRDMRVTVCARQESTDKDGKKTSACTNGNQWDNGWLVVVDADGDGDMDSSTKPLNVVPALAGANTIKNEGKGKKGSIVFTPTGTNESGAHVLTICDPRGIGRAVTVAATGRAYIKKIGKGQKDDKGKDQEPCK